MVLPDGGQQGVLKDVGSVQEQEDTADHDLREGTEQHQVSPLHMVTTRITY